MARIRTRAAWVILFWGGLWGLVEAVLGHALHLLRIPGLAGWIMFPVGFWMMRRAFALNGRAVVLAGIPAAAAAVKLADFLLPLSDPFMVINPAAAILLEGLAAGFLLMRSKEQTPSFLSLVAVSAAWRAAYFGWGSAAAALWGAPTVFGLDGFDPWRYFAFDPLIAAALIQAAFLAARSGAAAALKLRAGSRGVDRMAGRPAWAVASILWAAAVDILLRRG